MFFELGWASLRELDVTAGSFGSTRLTRELGGLSVLLLIGVLIKFLPATGTGVFLLLLLLLALFGLDCGLVHDLDV